MVGDTVSVVVRDRASSVWLSPGHPHRDEPPPSSDHHLPSSLSLPPPSPPPSPPKPCKPDTLGLQALHLTILHLTPFQSRCVAILERKVESISHHSGTVLSSAHAWFGTVTDITSRLPGIPANRRFSVNGRLQIVISNWDLSCCDFRAGAGRMQRSSLGRVGLFGGAVNAETLIRVDDGGDRNRDESIIGHHNP